MTAQAYREAAFALPFDIPEACRLLLAAAEQCEQLDKLLAPVAFTAPPTTVNKAAYSTSAVIDQQQQQIATLTERLEASRRQVAELIERIDRQGTEV